MIVTIDTNKPFCIIDLENHDYIISVQCISFVGETILPILLISRVNILYKWYQYNNLDDNIVIDIMETGYANNNIALEWL